MRRKKKYIPRRGGANRGNINPSWKVLETGEGPGVSPQHKGNERNGGKMKECKNLKELRTELRSANSGCADDTVFSAKAIMFLAVRVDALLVCMSDIQKELFYFRRKAQGRPYKPSAYQER